MSDGSADTSDASEPPVVVYRGATLSFDPSWAGRLASVRWFSCCGERDRTWRRRTGVVASPEEASERCTSVEWENFLLGRQNDLTEHLHLHHREAYRSWNDLVRWARTTLLPPLTPKIQSAVAAAGLAPRVCELVRFSLYPALMAQAYGPLVPDDLRFDLVPAYESGHLPYGWLGTYPRGRLLTW